MRFAAGSAASDAAMCERAALANTTPSANLACQRHHLLPQRRDDDRRELADAFHRAQLLDEGARVAERLAGVTPMR